MLLTQSNYANNNYVIPTMALYENIRMHAQGDLYFDNIENNPNSFFL